MKVHSFTIILDRVPNGGEIERLYESGCDDAAIGFDRGYAQAEFDREATSLAAAIVSAVHDIERAGFTAMRVIDDDLVTLGDIADRIGRSREGVRLYATGRRGSGGFPPPVNLEGEVRFWRWTEVAPWLRLHGVDAPEESITLAAANHALQFRALSKSSAAAPLRTLVA